MKKLLFTITVLSLVSCSNPNKVEVTVDSKATEVVTIYMPDGSIETHESLYTNNGSNSTRLYWTDMKGMKHNTTLPTRVDELYEKE